MQPSETSDPTARRDALASRLMYATLGLMDLGAVGMADQPSAATGTVIRTDTVRRYAAQAATEFLPVANDLFRFHRLRP